MKKTVLVTGATAGFGKAIAIKFASEGNRVIITGGRNERLNELVEEIQNKYEVEALGLCFDVRSEDQVISAIESIPENWKNIDILVNNAGITKDNLLMRISEEDFDKVIEVNLKSVFNLTKAVIRPMMKQRGGSIINMSSVVGLKGNAGQANYAASKAGIVGFSKSVALELGSRNIRSNVIAPGFIETEMTGKLDEAVVQSWRDAIPLKRGGQPKDIADACVFLGSDMSSYITGQTLSVDGGMLT